MVFFMEYFRRWILIEFPFNQGFKMHNDGSLPLVNELGMNEMTMSERVCLQSEPIEQRFQ